jgi:hypothetical protein
MRAQFQIQESHWLLQETFREACMVEIGISPNACKLMICGSSHLQKANKQAKPNSKIALKTPLIFCFH